MLYFVRERCVVLSEIWFRERPSVVFLPYFLIWWNSTICTCHFQSPITQNRLYWLGPQPFSKLILELLTISWPKQFGQSLRDICIRIPPWYITYIGNPRNYFIKLRADDGGKIAKNTPQNLSDCTWIQKIPKQLGDMLVHKPSGGAIEQYNYNLFSNEIYTIMYIKNNAWVTVNNDFWSRVRWFANENHLQINSRVTKKSLFMVTNVLFYFLHAILCPEHTIPLKATINRSFRHCRQRMVFFYLALWRHHNWSVMTREREALTVWHHIRRLFLHARFGAKAIFTRE